jgi:hypothetical protein
MTAPILTPTEAYDYLSKSIPKDEKGKDAVLGLCKWIADWDNTLGNNEKIMCYNRDTGRKNIGYVINRGDNLYKIHKPRFFIVKFPGTDRDKEFQNDLLLDFYFGSRNVPSMGSILIQRPSNPASWIIRGCDCNKLTIDELVRYVKYAYKKRA